jgi:hypothetical protein
MATRWGRSGLPKTGTLAAHFCPEHAFLPTNEKKEYLRRDRKKLVSPIKNFLIIIGKKFKGDLFFL